MPFNRLGELGTPLVSYGTNWVRRDSGLWVAEEPLNLKKESYILKEGRSAYLYMGTLYFTSSATFKKADYPGLRAVRVICVGGGGGGGGNPSTGSGEAAASVGGGGGECAIKFLLFDDLAASESVTVGSGGSGGSAGAAGGNGGKSSFGSHCVANGGKGGSGGIVMSSFPVTGEQGAAGGTGGTGDLVIPGGASTVPLMVGVGVRQGFSSEGGGSFFAPPTGSRRMGGNATGSNGAGEPAKYPGGGGGGLISRSGANATTGLRGADGIVIVELYG